MLELSQPDNWIMAIANGTMSTRLLDHPDQEEWGLAVLLLLTNLPSPEIITAPLRKGQR